MGPKSRLNAFKQLLNLSKYYSFNKDEIPFRVIPTTDEVRKLLFPCSIKHNEEVAAIVAKYELLSKKPLKEVI